jgi:hypothetical protein
LVKVGRHYDFATMRSILADHNVVHVEHKFLIGWLDADPTAAAVVAVQATGYDGPHGVEVISREHCRRPLDEVARLSSN